MKPKREDSDNVLAEINFDHLDVRSAQDVADIGTGGPVFSKFCFEDWSLLDLYYELYLLLYAVSEGEGILGRPSLPLAHLERHYYACFDKPPGINDYGFKEFGELVGIIKHTVDFCSAGQCLTPLLGALTTPGHFVKLQENYHRIRMSRVDRGDEAAVLRFRSPSTRRQVP